MSEAAQKVTPPSGRLPDSSVCLWLVLVCLGSRAALQAFGLKVAANKLIPVYPGFPTPSDFFGIWCRFDSTRYLDIIDKGYFKSYLGPAGWFPGYPYLVKTVSWLGNDQTIAVIVSNLSLLGGLYFMFRLYEMDATSRSARRAVILLLAFPSAFIFSSVYSESLFLLLTCASLLAVRRGYWKTAVVLASGASLVRLAGLVLVPVLAWEYIQSKKRWGVGLIWLLLPPLVVLVFFLHLHFAVGNFFEYFKIQEVYSQVLGIWRAYQSGRPLWIEHKVGLAFLGLQLFFLVITWRGMRPSYRLYVVLSLFMTIYHTQGVCSHRFALVLFPLFFGVERRLSRWSYPIVVSLFVVGQLILFAFWVQGHRATY